MGIEAFLNVRKRRMGRRRSEGTRYIEPDSVNRFFYTVYARLWKRNHEEKGTCVNRGHTLVLREKWFVTGKHDVCKHELGERVVDGKTVWVAKADTTQLTNLVVEARLGEGDAWMRVW